MVDKYRALLENLSSLAFSRLMEAARRTNEPMSRTSKPNLTSCSGHVRPLLTPRKSLIVASLENDQRSRTFNSKKPPYRLKFKPEHRQERKALLNLPPFLCDVKKATVLLEQWTKDAVIQLPFVEQSRSQEQIKEMPNIVPIITRRGILWKSVLLFKRFWQKAWNRGDYTTDERVLNIHEWPFPNHNNEL